MMAQVRIAHEYTPVLRMVLEVQHLPHGKHYKIGTRPQHKTRFEDSYCWYHEKFVEVQPPIKPCVLSVQSKPIAYWRWCCGR